METLDTMEAHAHRRFPETAPPGDDDCIPEMAALIADVRAAKAETQKAGAIVAIAKRAPPKPR